MSNVTTGAERSPHDMSHFVYSVGNIGRLKVLSHQNVAAGESLEIDAIGSFRLSPLKRGLALDTCVELFTFYVPYRHVYGDTWVDMMKAGPGSGMTLPLETYIAKSYETTSFLGMRDLPNGACPKWLFRSYENIYNNYFKVPYFPDVVRQLDTLEPNTCGAGYQCQHLKTIWSAPLDGDTATQSLVDTQDNGGTPSIDIMNLNQAYGQLHSQQTRDAFMHRYRDVVESFGGSTTIDADQRPLLLMRTKHWASGYDVDGTDQTSLGQFSGRVQQSFEHKVPRWFAPEHGVVMTLVLARFPPIMYAEHNYLVSEPAVTYEDIANDPAVVGNAVPLTVSASRFIPNISHNIKIPFGQWFRYHNSHVDVAYSEIGDFPFVDSGTDVYDDVNLMEIQADAYNDIFQTLGLGHWNIQSKFNCTVYRSMPSARDSIITS